MSDPTENVRRQMTASINAVEGSREYLEERHGAVYDTKQMQEIFQPLSFAAPLIVVQKRDTGEKGSLFFQHEPRFYFSWQPE